MEMKEKRATETIGLREDYYVVVNPDISTEHYPILFDHRVDVQKARQR